MKSENFPETRFDTMPRIKTEVYVPYTVHAPGDDRKPTEITIMIPSGTTPSAAVRRLVECYRPAVED